MAPEDGRKSAALSEKLLREPFRFNFFQAVRLLERLAREHAREDPRWPCGPLGEDQAPHQEAMRFHVLASQSFPAAAVSQVKWPEEQGQENNDPLPNPEMVVTFMGLTGSQGVLPRHYSTLLMQRIRNKDFALNAFNWLAAREYRLSVAPREEERRMLDVHQGDKVETLRTLALFLLPGLCLMLGIATWYLRRR